MLLSSIVLSILVICELRGNSTTLWCTGFSLKLNSKKTFKASSVLYMKKHYPFSSRYFENYLKRLNSRNITVQTDAILHEDKKSEEYTVDDISSLYDERTRNKSFTEYKNQLEERYPELFNHTFHEQPLIISPEIEKQLHDDMYGEDDYDVSIPEAFYREQKRPVIKEKKNVSKNEHKFSRFHRPAPPSQSPSSSSSTSDVETNIFELVTGISTRFTDIGGYESVKEELNQCVDILMNYETYAKYNVRVPKGLILEGPPGNGKTLLAKGFAGECSCSFIQVSGSEFQEKYVGVGSARVKELFKLAEKNAPCVIFIDEIDALGRKRSSDGESSGSEKDNTLNQLLIAMDGFHSSDGVFLIGATNRADLLDPALMRPGRIDKRIFISVPDSKTREAILNIHINGKPHDDTIVVADLVDLTNGMSAAQIENVLNEAMLLAIRHNRTEFSYKELDIVMNRILAGWQPTEHQFSQELIEQIIVHEMGHAMVGFLAKQHSKLTKIVINLSSPNTPGYTVFEGSTSALYTRDSLFEHLMILLAGRVAEEVFYNVSVTTGAINDFEEALKLAEKMVIYYGMGSSLIYPSNSEKYKEQIDNEVVQLIQEAYDVSRFIVANCKEVIKECTEILQRERIMRRDDLLSLIENKYPDVMDLYIGNE